MSEELGEYHTTGPVEGEDQHCVRCGASIPGSDGQRFPEGSNVREYEDILGGQIHKTEWRPVSADDVSSGAFVACEPSKSQ